MTTRSLRGAAVAVAALAIAACGAKTVKLPAPGAPAADGTEALAQATTVCAGVRTLTAEVGVSGRIGSQKMRGRLTVGLAAPASARIEAVAPFGAPVFIFVAKGDEATLVLPRDARVLRNGRADAVLDAVSGVPLGPADLRSVLTGCPIGKPSAADARTAGDDWRIVAAGDDTIYLHRSAASAPWQTAAIVHAPADGAPWRAEYRDFQSALPRTVHLAGEGRFDLTLALSQVDVNVPLGDDVFEVEAPRGASPITLDELRRAGPLADRQPRSER